MELCRCDLRAFVRGPGLTERQVAWLFLRVLRVVKGAHDCGVMLGDVRPENFLLRVASWAWGAAFGGRDVLDWPCTMDELAKGVYELCLADFGFSWFCCEGSELDRLCGYPGYCAPEVLLRRYSRSADLWSAGIMLYTFLCGRPPFEAKSFEESLAMSLDMDVPQLLGTGPWTEISSEAKTLVLRLLERDPSKRIAVEAAIHVTIAWGEACAAGACEAPLVTQEPERPATSPRDPCPPAHPPCNLDHVLSMLE
uniref:Protein kinase domain-containing protein n=1 Tax=Eutreptiella gymnastica TaxID=73025 RepID=A0A7S4FQG1_9EUGL